MGQKEKYLLRFTHLYLVHRLSWCRSIYFLSQCIEKCVSERLATAAVVDKVRPAVDFFYEESEIWASLSQFGSLEFIYVF